MRLPNFLFIGADKSGSTWLFNVLRQNPDCFVPAAKDVYFFDRYYARGLGWYSRLFAAAPPGVPAVGEVSHDYLYSADAAERIAETLPHAKLVVFLRHPVERAFSEYLYLVRSGEAEPGRLLETLALNDAPLEHSRYARYLPAYLDRFPREQVGIFFFDDLVRDPAGLARRVHDFLGVRHVDLDYGERVLPAARPRSARVARMARVAATATRALGSPTLVGKVKASRPARMLYATYSPDDRPRLTEEARRVLHEALDPDLPALERLLGAELPQWRSGAAGRA